MFPRHPAMHQSGQRKLQLYGNKKPALRGVNVLLGDGWRQQRPLPLPCGPCASIGTRNHISVFSKDLLNKINVFCGQDRSTSEYCDNTTIAETFFRAIFVEVKAAFLLVIKEVKILFGEFAFNFCLIFAAYKGSIFSIPKSLMSILSISL